MRFNSFFGIKKKKRELIIWGGAGQMRVLEEIVRIDGYKIICVVDNRDLGLVKEGADFLVGFDALKQWVLERSPQAQLYSAVAIGGASGKDRVLLLKELKGLNLLPINLVHPSAEIASGLSLGEGCQILIGSKVAVNVRIGDGCIINSGAIVDHDCILGSGVHIGPGATVAGEVLIGENTFIGAGATILPKLEIGENVIVGAGSVVTRNLCAGEIVAGVPARKIK